MMPAASVFLPSHNSRALHLHHTRQVKSETRQMSEKEKEPKRRKLVESDDVAATQNHRKALEDNGEGTTVNVDEEEVDEFFAILRRIHVAVDYFKRFNGDARQLTESESMELDTEHNGVKDEGKLGSRPRVGNGNVGLDLNADPGTDLD